MQVQQGIAPGCRARRLERHVVLGTPCGQRRNCVRVEASCPLRTPASAASSQRRRSRRSCVQVLNESPIVEDYGGAVKSKFSAPVFNRTRWTYHQNTGRYQRHLTSIFRSVTFRNLQSPLSYISFGACCVVLYRTLVEMGDIEDYFEGVHFTDVPFQLTSFALSLLLVFRTDASYSRWCAAMDAWGVLRTSANSVMRKAASWIPDGSILRRLVRWVAAYALCLMVQLRNDMGAPEEEASLRKELQAVLRPFELEQVMGAGPYYHQFCLSVLTALVEAADLPEGREATVLEDLAGFCQAAGECEKILRFPIPLTYTRHTSRFMLIYLTALPLALYDSCDWATIPVTVTISFLLLGIEDIGVQIEEPFSILPLPEICADLHTSAQLAVSQRRLVRCLASPDTCPSEWEVYGAGVVNDGSVSAVSLAAQADSVAEKEAAAAAATVTVAAGASTGGRDAMSKRAAAGVSALRSTYANGNGKVTVAAIGEAAPVSGSRRQR